MRRSDREMPESFAYEIADKALWAMLSLVDAQGNPYGVPLSLVRDGKDFYFHCASEGLKLDCLKANPNVCISCVGEVSLDPARFTARYQSAIFHGKALEITDANEKKEVLVKLVERFAKENKHNMKPEIAGYMDQTGIWKIRVSQATAKENK